MKRFLLVKKTAVLIAIILFAAGCLPRQGPTPTVTPNPTLLAITRMLTQTSAAPSVTPTVFVTPTETPLPTPTAPFLGSQQKPGKMGELVQSDGASLVVMSASLQSTAGKLKALQGRAYLNVQVQLGNTVKTSIPYTPLYFQLLGPSDAAISPAADAQWPELQSGDLVPGEQVRGYIAFDVPADANPGDFRLEYGLPSTSGGPMGLWVSLGQTSVDVPLTGSGFEPANTLPDLGKRVEAGGLALTVVQVATQAQIGFTKPADGHVLVEMQVTLENINHTLAPYNPGYFKVKDANGYEYQAITLPSEDLLQAGGLQRGQKVSGHVVFEVPQEDTRLMVKYLPLVLTDEYAEIRVMVDVPPPLK